MPNCHSICVNVSWTLLEDEENAVENVSLNLFRIVKKMKVKHFLTPVNLNLTRVRHPERRDFPRNVCRTVVYIVVVPLTRLSAPHCLQTRWPLRWFKENLLQVCAAESGASNRNHIGIVVPEAPAPLPNALRTYEPAVRYKPRSLDSDKRPCFLQFRRWRVFSFRDL